MKRLFLILMCLLGVSSLALAQTTVTGNVTDASDNTPLPGVNVIIKGTTTGTITDGDGNFSIKAKDGNVLQFTSIGYVAEEVTLTGQTNIKIALVTDMVALADVVVVGYGTQRKADLTGSVAIVNAEEMKKVSHSNISSMLEGKVAGVQITSDGQPGADPSVRIRGIGSFGSTAPLYVVDGVPMGTTIRDFSPNDIETIQILKDASAAAVYGSRAANGVVIITTKQGSKNQKMRIDYSGYVGFDNIKSNVYEVMNAEQYKKHITTAFKNSNTILPSGYDPNSPNYISDVDTDWFNEIFKTGVRQNHNVNISGGGENNTYNMAFDYFDQKGTIRGAGPNYNRYTARINNNMDVKFIKLKTGVVYSHSYQDNMSTSNADEYVQGVYGTNEPVIEDAHVMAPTIKAYDDATWCLDDVLNLGTNFTYDAYGYGTYYDHIHGDISQVNPLIKNNRLIRNTTVDRIIVSGSAEVDLLDMVGLKNDNHKFSYKANLSYGKTFCKDFTFLSAYLASNRCYLAKDNERLTQAYRMYDNALVENLLTYDGVIGANHINLIVGQTYEHENHHSLTGVGINLPEPYYLQVNNGKERDANSYQSEHVLASYIARLNYDFDERYLISATVRRDGSSRLSPDDRWGVFPSVSAGWRLDRESFFPVSNEIINLLKIRGSYGVLGSENIGEYQYMDAMTRSNMTYSFGGTPVLGSAISNFVNKDIKWEKKKSIAAGIDLGMFNNKLEFTAEYYKNISEDLLYAIAVPANAGVANTSVTMNAASMENSGFEFSATYRNRAGDFKYDISANVSTLKNEITKLGVLGDNYITGNHISAVGEEIGKFYGYVYEGIFQDTAQIAKHAVQNGAQPGDCAYADVNGDGVINADDRVVLGSGLPKVNFGLSARFEYKGFDLAISTYGALGYKVTDHLYNVLHGSYGAGNKSVDLLNAWTPENTNTDVPRVAFDAGSGWNDYFSSRMIQNANYWKIANVELGYNFPNAWFGDVVSNVRLYVSGQNLFTFTKYEGYNIDYAGGTFTPGFNYCSYPTPRTFMAGLKFSF